MPPQKFTEEICIFQGKVLKRSGLGGATYIPPCEQQLNAVSHQQRPAACSCHCVRQAGMLAWPAGSSGPMDPAQLAAANERPVAAAASALPCPAAPCC